MAPQYNALHDERQSLRGGNIQRGASAYLGGTRLRPRTTDCEGGFLESRWCLAERDRWPGLRGRDVCHRVRHLRDVVVPVVRGADGRRVGGPLEALVSAGVRAS